MLKASAPSTAAMRQLAITVCLAGVMASVAVTRVEAAVHVRVTPSRVLRNTAVKVSYRVSMGERVKNVRAHRFTRRYYLVAMTTSGGGSGCARTMETTQGSDLVVRRGGALADTLDPAVGVGQQWCAGRWRGRIVLVHDRCSERDSIIDCPSRSAVSHVVRRFRFRVRSDFAHNCRVAGSETVLNMATARLYSSNDDLWGCLNAVGRRVMLAQNVNGIDGNYTRPRVAGDFTAYGAFEGSPCARYMQCPPGYQPNIYTAVVNLRTGARRVASGTEPAGDALVLTASGAMAWIACASGDCSAPAVHVYDSAGERVVDGGAGIDPRSLRLAAHVSSVSWTHDGAPRSVVLG